MALSPIAFTIPNYRDYKNYWLKAYEPSTTTPKAMALDSEGVTLVAKLELNKDGFPESAGGTLVIPYIDGAYDLYAFPTEAEADANDTVNALRFADDITGVNGALLENETVFKFDTVEGDPESAKESTNTQKLFDGAALNIRERTTGNGGGAMWDVVLASSVTPNGFDVVQCIGVPSLALVLRLPNDNPKAWGVVSDGVTDDKAAWSNLFSSGQKEINTDGIDTFLSSTLTISSQPDLRILGKGLFKCNDLNGCLVFDDCDHLLFDGARGEGNLDKAAWEALTEPERFTQKGFFNFDNCYDIDVANTEVVKFYTGVKFDGTTFSKISKPNHIGCFGEIAGGTVTTPNTGYSLFIRGGSDIKIDHPISSQSSGGVLIQLTAPRIKSYGGEANNCHDNGWYGSSTEYSLCDGFSVKDGLSDGVKMRGSYNTISNNTAENIEAIAFVHSGIPLDSAIDPQGAVGAHSSIVGNKAKNVQALARIDRVVENVNDLYMRDCIISANDGEDMTGSQIPIEVFGVKNMRVTDNNVNTFAASSGLFASGEGVGSELANLTMRGNTVSNGQRFFTISNTKESLIESNKFENIAQTISTVLVNVFDTKFSFNHGDDVTRRIDIRNLTGMNCQNNEMFIQANSADSYVAEGNDYNGLVDTSTVIPVRTGQIVQDNSGNMFIAKGVASTADWVAL